MINTVELPETTKKHLNEVVKIQMLFLAYAAQLDLTNLSQGEIIQTFSKTTCTKFIHSQVGFESRAEQLAGWLFNRPKHNSLLKQFALHSSEKEKKVLVERLQSQILIFEEGKGKLESVALANREDPKWMLGAWDFLIAFYDHFKKFQFPGYFFSQENAKAYSGKDFLTDFNNKNKELNLCPACDIGPRDTLKDEDFVGSIDHYFPKSRYPHLALHPLNLVSVCPLCNSSIKLDKDPFYREPTRPLLLEQIFLPYRRDGLYNSTFLQISRTEDKKFFLGPIIPRSNLQVTEQVETAKHLFEIPHRWNNSAKQKVHTIGEQIYRRMRNFFAKDGVPSQISNLVDDLDFHLFQTNQEQGLEPNVYARTWLLAGLTNKEVEPFQESNDFTASPLLKTISQWPRAQQILIGTFEKQQFVQEGRNLRQFCK